VTSFHLFKQPGTLSDEKFILLVSQHSSFLTEAILFGMHWDIYEQECVFLLGLGRVNIARL